MKIFRMIQISLPTLGLGLLWTLPTRADILLVEGRHFIKCSGCGSGRKLPINKSAL